MYFEILTLLSLLFNVYLYLEIRKVKEVIVGQRKGNLTILDIMQKDYELIKYNKKVCDAVCETVNLYAQKDTQKSQVPQESL